MNPRQRRFRSTLSDGGGLMTLEASDPGRYAVSVAAAQYVTRQTRVSIPGSDAFYDFDDFQRWTA